MLSLKPKKARNFRKFGSIFVHSHLYKTILQGYSLKYSMKEPGCTFFSLFTLIDSQH